MYEIRGSSCGERKIQDTENRESLMEFPEKSEYCVNLDEK